jgi:cytochrome c peroxidase
MLSFKAMRASLLPLALAAAALLALAHCSSTPGTTAAADAGADVGVDAAPVSAACAAYRAGPDGAYPKGAQAVELLATLPDLELQGPTGPVALHTFYDPCAPQASLLVLRVTAGFCGPCLWSAAHSAEITAEPRVTLVDLLVRSELNLPATTADIAPFAAKVGPKATVLLDPAHRFGSIDPKIPLPLPILVYVDRRTMRVLSYQSNPPPDDITFRIRTELAIADKTPRPSDKRPAPVDGLFQRNEWEMAQAMSVAGIKPPKDPTNAYADDPAAAAFGKKLFGDASLSGPGTVSCATCHDPARSFQDGLATSTGVSTGDRNAPSALFAAHSTFQFWDGRADSLWMQAVGPIENPGELASSRLRVAHRIADSYAADYAAVFGAKYTLPPLSDTARFPANGMPGDAAYDAMSAADKDAVTRVFVNAGKAIAAYERSLTAEPSRLDKYVAGDFTALADSEKEALKAFFVVGCAMCHWGPMFTDNAFHNIRFPTGRQDGVADEGASAGIPKLLTSEFRAGGPYSDAPTSVSYARFTPDAIASLRGKFKTPILRGVADTGPWGHGGTIADLHLVAKHYGERGLKEDDPRAVGPVEPWIAPFDDHTQHLFGGLLQSMSAPPRP